MGMLPLEDQANSSGVLFKFLATDQDVIVTHKVDYLKH